PAPQALGRLSRLGRARRALGGPARARPRSRPVDPPTHAERRRFHRRGGARDSSAAPSRAPPVAARGVLALLPARRGHFLFESGHHGDLWLDLELLCLTPDRLRPLAARLASYEIDAVCGPLVEGAFVALMVASELGVPFRYAERFENPARGGLF